MALAPAPRSSRSSQTDHGESILNRVRGRIQASDQVVWEGRRRRDRVRSVAEQFVGALRSFASGSLAHATVNRPVKDADCGGVLDRRSWPELGRDGAGVGPGQIVQAMAEFIIERLREDWPAVTYTITQRAILFEFHEPLGDEDPRRILRSTWLSP